MMPPAGPGAPGPPLPFFYPVHSHNEELRLVIDLSLEGKTAVITGGSRGIGRAIARTFADAGAGVVLAARGAEELEKAAQEIESNGGRALAVRTDVGDNAQVEALMAKAVEGFGSIDILVNNAGAAPFLSTIDQMRMDGFEKYFRIDFTSAVYCTRAAAPHLMKREGSSVLNVASVAGYIASPGLSYYASAKAALINFTRTVAQEWASSKVRVNAVAPGWIATELNAGARATDPSFGQAMLDSIPLGRLGEPEDIAAAALFLCSPAASFITGSVLVLDGGQTLSALAGR
jgi:NAD(P)-dependent dehydrogenase (short-subunit alcohol dehydrogenase family)